MTAYITYHLDWEYPIFTELHNTFIKAYGNSNSGKNIVEIAGIDLGTYPENYENARELWLRLIEVMNTQCKLRNLIKQAINDETISKSYHEDFQKLLYELEQQQKKIELQRKLLDYVTKSELPYEKLNQIYRKCCPSDFEDGTIKSLDQIIQNLFDYDHDHKLLVQFLWLVGVDTTIEDIQAAIQKWCCISYKESCIDLTESDVTQLLQTLESKLENRDPAYIAIKVLEEWDDHYRVELYIDSDNNIRLIDEPQIFADLSNAQQYILRNVESYQSIYEIQNIELYLPCNLLDLEGDQWFINRSPLMADANMIVGHSIRLQASAKWCELQELKNARKTEQLHKQVQILNKGPLWDYILPMPKWIQCWATLNDDQIDCLSNIQCSISHGDIQNENKIEKELDNERINYVAFNCSPNKFSDRSIQEALKPLIKLGVPVIWWPRGNADFEDISDLEQTLKKCIFDKYNNREIANIYDFIQIITEVRRDSRLYSDDQTHLGKHLTLIVDNPNRSILERNRLVT